MEAIEIIKSLNGFLWEAIYQMKLEDCIESDFEPSVVEVVMGPMTELEKALFTIKASLLCNLMPFFEINEDDEAEIQDFFEFVVLSSQVDFLDKYVEKSKDQDKIMLDQEAALVIRTQFLAAHNFLNLITSQRFSLLPEDVVINYRQGYQVTIMDVKLFNIQEN